MTRPDHPLLTKVLADALHQPWHTRYCVHEGPDADCEIAAADEVAAIPPDIADRLEAALDPGCRYTLSREAFDPIPDEDVLCGLGPDGASHHHLAECGDGSHAPYPGCHTYVPLVEVAAPAASPEAWRCEAILYHGPGHQSRAQCERTDEHPLSGEHYAGRTYRFQWEGPGDQPATATAAATSEEDR